MIAKTDDVELYRHMVADYIDGVSSGRIVAGKLVQFAVERHCRDLVDGPARGLYFNPDVAIRSCVFFPRCLRHSKGEFAGEPFELSAWQAFVTWSLFGWQYAQTKLRRFRKAYLSVARKNGKTTFAAGIALKTMYFDEPLEPGAQVFCVATKEDQAKLLYTEARLMVEQCPWLRKRSRIRKAPNSIDYESKNSYFRPLGSDSDGTDGLNPHCIVEDELHAWRERHRELREKLSTGGGARRQPLELVITTAGDADSQLWIEEDKYAVDCLEASHAGNVFDDSYFAFPCRIDDEDDPFNRDTWIKANPNLGVSAKVEYLDKQANEAQRKPSATNQFIRYHCNRMTEATERSFSPEAWNAGAQPITVQPGDVAHGGIDVGRTNDWAAVSLVFPKLTTLPDGTENRSWQTIVRAWTCSDGRFKVNHEPFRTWIKNGLLGCSDGNCIDLREVEEWIVEQSQNYQVQTWAFDKTFARELAQRLQDEHGLQVFEFTQTPRFYNEPFRRLVDELPKGTFVHGNDPVLNWQAANVQTYRNHKDEWMPDKSQPDRKIDGIVAMLMAFSECLFAENKSISGPAILY